MFINLNVIVTCFCVVGNPGNAERVWWWWKPNIFWRPRLFAPRQQLSDDWGTAFRRVRLWDRFNLRSTSQSSAAYTLKVILSRIWNLVQDCAHNISLVSPIPDALFARYPIPPMQISNLEQIKVIYDISVLGQGHLHSRARTGVFRVVENLAQGLAKSPECDLSFCTTQYFQLVDAALDYLETNPKLKDIPLLHSSATRIIYRKLIEAYNLLEVQTQVNHNAIATEEKSYFPEVKSHLESALVTMSNYWSSIDPNSLEEVDIFHSPYDEIPAAVKIANKPQNFLTVYDLIPILYPQFILDERVAWMQKKNLASIAQKDWVICISQSTKNDLCNYIKIDESRVFVTHLAAEPTVFYPCRDAAKIASTRSKYGIPEGEYILSLSTLEPRKNLDTAIRSFAKLIQEQKIRDLYLVLVGAPGWKYENILAEVSQQGVLKERIIFTGYVPEFDLAALYSGALAFVYPSFYEGFGLPPLEAMQCGIPAITSNNSSLGEVVGEAGITIDPKDIDGICDSMLQIYNKPSLREAMSLKSLAQAKKFSWERCTQETLAAYRTALS